MLTIYYCLQNRQSLSPYKESQHNLEAVECGSIMNHCFPIHLILYAYVITRAL